MSDQSDEFQEKEGESEEINEGEDMEAARVARYALYISREKKPLRKGNLKPVLDEFRDKHDKKDDPVSRSKKILQKSLGLTIVDGRKDQNEKNKSNFKQFVVRSEPYPENVSLPFTSEEKAEYGLLMFVFIIIYFKNGSVDQNSLLQILNETGFVDGGSFGPFAALIQKWVREDYIKIEKVDDPTLGPKSRTNIGYGERFYAEFGDQMIQESCKNLIDLDNEKTQKNPQNSTTLPESDSGSTDGSKFQDNKAIKKDDDLSLDD